MRIHASGRVYVWHGGSLWIGRSSGTTDMHAHHAIQIAVALEGAFGLRTPEADNFLSYSAAIVPSHQPHSLSTSDSVTAITFVEPEAKEGRLLLERFGRSGVVAIPDPLATDVTGVLAASYHQGFDESRLVSAARDAVCLLTAGTQVPVVVDDRIERAIELVRAGLGGPVVQSEIADAVCLSPSRFRHLFVEETGMAFRPYVLWMRLQRAMQSITSGESLTEAAYTAGFADPAHMSRTFRRMFGISPGMLEQRKRVMSSVAYASE